MGFFDVFRKTTTSSTAQSGLNLSKEQAVEMLNLRKETFALTLEKKAIHNPRARVAVVMDESGSMSDLYENGTVQSVIERILPVALKLDDNGELDIWTFNSHFKRFPSITEEEFYNYVNREIMPKISWGGTRYAPVIYDIVKKYVKEEPSDIPTFVIFITDGENADREEARRAITEASNHNIFFQFIGIGNENFKFLQELDDLKGRKIDNADFFKIQNINKISDDDLYNKLMTEYPHWEKEARQLGMIQ